MDIEKLRNIAKKFVASRKGILAADASNNTMNKRLAAIGVEQTEEMRRQYRQLLFTTPGIEKYISGVILYDETIRQKTDEGISMPSLLASKGIMPGIKVDEGLVQNPQSPNEQITTGLQGLAERLLEYKKLGAVFTKWRATYIIADGLPTKEDITLDAWILGQYAKISQDVDMVPIVEPEVLMDGNHTITRCKEVTIAVQKQLFAELKVRGVYMPGVILKTNMVLAGKDSFTKISPEEVADHTLSALQETVPSDIGGVVFLSGGQSPKQATENLQYISSRSKYPWQMTFSYSRALQEPVLESWLGKLENMPRAQEIFLHRLHMNSLAREGQYTEELDR